MIKKISIGIAVTFMLTACATQQTETVANNPKLAKIIAQDATELEIETAIEYEKHIKAVKKTKKRRDRLKKTNKINLDKFCFKDDKSIHYRSNEKCE